MKSLRICVLLMAAILIFVDVARAERAGPGETPDTTILVAEPDRSRPPLREGVEPALDRRFCRRGFEDLSALARSEASLDLYNGILFAGLAGGLSFGVETDARWSGVNDFDDDLRDGLGFESQRNRNLADRASDAVLGFTIVGMPLASITAELFNTRDCVEAWDMLTDMVESMGLALALTESLKVATGRARPFERQCGRIDSPNLDCSGDDRFKSFVSGHASVAGTGAGLTCAFSIRRKVWGRSMLAKALPCGLGVAGALATGSLRIAAERHWATDVLTGLAAGAVIGFFDTWGPFDLLRFETRDASGRIERSGFLVPTSHEGRIGFRFSMVF